MKHLPNITISPCPHKEQRYDTAGDYGDSQFGWWINVSEMKDWRHEFLVIIHELVEMGLTKNDNVFWEDIDKFDTEGEGKDHADPGTLESAPYHIQHERATNIEKLFALYLGVDWEEYNNELDKLEYGDKP